MFYVSSVLDEDYKIGVTDTDDGVENFFTNKELSRIVHDKKIKVYGTSYYNYRVDCTVLKPNQVLSSSKLQTLLRKWRAVHNRWNGYPVEDYLAMCRVGSKIIVDYSYPVNGALKQGITTLVKLDTDKWKYTDTNNTFSDTIADSVFASWCLDIIEGSGIRKIQVS